MSVVTEVDFEIGFSDGRKRNWQKIADGVTLLAFVES